MIADSPEWEDAGPAGYGVVSQLAGTVMRACRRWACRDLAQDVAAASRPVSEGAPAWPVTRLLLVAGSAGTAVVC